MMLELYFGMIKDYCSLKQCDARASSGISHFGFLSMRCFNHWTITNGNFCVGTSSGTREKKFLTCWILNLIQVSQSCRHK